MTHTARYYGGHVRGIIGDRVMVIFDKDGAFGNSVDCAIAMNSILQNVINTRFKANEVACGIGIDSGKMLATKTGIRRHKQEQGNYRNLVWLGRPANIASTLTDLANKPSEEVHVPIVSVAYEQPQGGGLGAALSNYSALSPGPLSPFAIPPSLFDLVAPPSTTLVDLFALLARLGFTNQFFNDSWMVGFWGADHGGNGLELGRRAWTLAQTVLGSLGSQGAA